MSFPKMPDVSKSKINQAGQSILNAKIGTDQYSEALAIINSFRVAHAYPINTFVATLRVKTKRYNGTIVAQRLKRLPTILYKLKRFNTMQLSRMQDIGGIRAIMRDVVEVRSLRDDYVIKGGFSHSLISEHDYIFSPKNDGYRGIHLVYSYNNTLSRSGNADQYKGLLIELQIRTTLQHEWATAVETVGVMRSEALKSQKGDKNWLELFKYASSIFAISEDSPVVESHEKLSTREIFEKAYDLMKSLKALEAMRSWSIAAGAIHEEGVGGYYNIILLNMDTNKIRILGFPKDKIEDASKKYAELEAEASEKGSPEPVLVSVGRLDDLRKAYPNYFLDIQKFAKRLEEIAEVVQEGL